MLLAALPQRGRVAIVVLFALCILGFCLLLIGRRAAFAGYGLFALGGTIKFYPAALLALPGLQSPPRTGWLLTATLLPPAVCES